MKIIKYGERPPKRVTCDGCDAVIEYILKDLTEELRFDGEGINHFFRCPLCGVKIYVGDWFCD